MKKIAIAALLLAAAAANGAELAAPLPLYAVEVVVFEHLDQTLNTAETPKPPEPFAVAQPARPTAGPGAGRQLEFLLLSPAPEAQVPRELPVDERRLASAYRRLERLDAYRPLAYLAWTQAALARDAAEALWLDELGAPPPGLNGRIALYKERFLHLVLDLRWDGAGRDLAGAEGWPAAARIGESRRLRGDLVQYFDHPRFGAIAYVRELGGDADGEPEPAG